MRSSRIVLAAANIFGLAFSQAGPGNEDEVERSLMGRQMLTAPAVPYRRLSINDSVLLIVDLQVGLTPLVRDWDATHFKNSMFAHAAMGKLFDIPVIMTTSFETGPNGPLPREFLETYPNAPLIPRPGQIDAWDNEDFRAAVRATNRSQMIIGGITTDVCVAELALSLRAEGYHVAVNTEASGTFSQRVADYAFGRMQAAGVQIMNMFSIQAELFRDWRNVSPNATQFLEYLDRYLPEESWVVRAHAAAIDSGSLVGGEMKSITIDEKEGEAPL